MNRRSTRVADAGACKATELVRTEVLAFEVARSVRRARPRSMPSPSPPSTRGSKTPSKHFRTRHAGRSYATKRSRSGNGFPTPSGTPSTRKMNSTMRASAACSAFGRKSSESQCATCPSERRPQPRERRRCRRAPFPRRHLSPSKVRPCSRPRHATVDSVLPLGGNR